MHLIEPQNTVTETDCKVYVRAELYIVKVGVLLLRNSFLIPCHIIFHYYELQLKTLFHSTHQPQFKDFHNRRERAALFILQYCEPCQVK